MASTEPTPIVLGEEHLSDLLALTVGAGWNQTEDDCRLFLRQGTVFGRQADGRVVASAALLPYRDGGFAWVSLVLVAPEWRRRGLATALVGECLDLARRLELVPLLDATPDGAKVYGPLGFETMFALSRWTRPPVGTAAEVEPGDPTGLAALIEADGLAMGADRGFLLRDFASRPTARTIWCGTHRGGAGAILRPGRLGSHLGPLAGSDEAAAIAVLEKAAASAGSIVVDVVDRWTGLTDALVRLGFRQQRPFLRMVGSPDAVFGDPDRLFLAAGPEYG